MNLQEQIDTFLNGSPHAVIGASEDRSKYGNKVLRVFQQHHRAVYPINPKTKEIEGLTAYVDLASLPELVHGISVITPPSVTEQVVKQAETLGIKNIWMQPGAESPAAVKHAQDAGMNVIADGPCILVVMGFRE